MKVLLISGGYINTKWAVSFLKLNNYDKIIAVDGGLSAANLLGIYPDIVVGDLDTVSEDVIVSYENNNAGQVIRLNPVKDDTDTQYAMMYAINMGAKEIHIIGGTGNRFDHMLANVYLLKLAYEKGVRAYLFDEMNKIYIISGHTKLKKDKIYNKYISFIQLEGPALNVTLEGFKYQVSNFDFDTSKQYRLAVSNEYEGEEASVTIGKGMLVAIEVCEK